MDAKLFSPAAERNRDPIAEKLRELLPARGTVLEIASGSGQHAVHFARVFAHLQWQPTDVDPDALASIAAWREEAALANLLTPRMLDVTMRAWPIASVQAIFCANMIHISPWDSCLGLMEGAGKILPAGAPLILYGPYFIAGRETAPSNLDFDRSLRMRDPSWGVRHLDEVTAVAERHGLVRRQVHDLPANNFLVVFQKQSKV